MKWTGLNDLREMYLSFFESKGHLRHKSFPLVPINDKSILLINAGMTPLKKYFTGELEPPRRRMTTCQKCIRTPDIDRVGLTARHGTFFEMLGNFSFGDYFKHDAIHWAWEFITERLELPEDRLWVTVYLEDDEAYDIWEKEIGVDPSHISTAARSSAAALPTASRDVTATGSWNSGTLFSRSSTTTGTTTIPALQSPISTPEWGLSALPALCRGSTTSLRWIPSETS